MSGLDNMSANARSGGKSKKVAGQEADDEVMVGGVGSEGGYKSPMKLKWTSTQQMDNAGSFQDTLRRAEYDEDVE